MLFRLTFQRFMRQRSAWKVRLFAFIAMTIMLMFFFRHHNNENEVILIAPTLLVIPTTTPFNRTWWDAKSYPKSLGLTDCSTRGLTRHNVSLLASLKKVLDIRDGPPPDKDGLCGMSFEDLELYYHTYFSTIQRRCRRSMRMGHTTDGGWDVCSDEIKTEQDNCLVYSFGIQYDFSFDDEMASIFGCEVHSFDPSMHQNDHLHNPSVYFHNTGLSDYNGVSDDMASWKMRTFKTIREELNHMHRTPGVVKMDIESWEWNVLPDMLMTSQLYGVKQLLVEFHASIDSRTKEYWVHKLLILRGLYLEGYRVFWVGRNMMCTYTSPVFNRKLYGCYEVSFVKVKSKKPSR